MSSSTEAEYVELFACSKEVELLSMLLEEMNEIQKPSVVYEDNQGAILLAKNRKIGMSTKRIGIHHHFIKDMVEDKDIGIK